MDTTPKVIKDKHIKGFLHAENSTKLFEFIGFGMADKLEQIKSGVPFHIAYHLEENNYMGNKSLILNLKYVRFDA